MKWLPMLLFASVICAAQQPEKPKAVPRSEVSAEDYFLELVQADPFLDSKYRLACFYNEHKGSKYTPARFSFLYPTVDKDFFLVSAGKDFQDQEEILITDYHRGLPSPRFGSMFKLFTTGLWEAMFDELDGKKFHRELEISPAGRFHLSLWPEGFDLTTTLLSSHEYYGKCLPTGVKPEVREPHWKELPGGIQIRDE